MEVLRREMRCRQSGAVNELSFVDAGIALGLHFWPPLARRACAVFVLTILDRPTFLQ